jgi:transcriptional regulator with PAS, ATPase and Fis domain
MKTLVSWHAYNNDFSQGKVIEDGPTVGFHDYFYKHDRHIILSTENPNKEDLRALHLRTFLLKRFPNRQIEIRYMDINDVINQSEIRSKIDPFLVSLENDEIDIFVSPGTPAMQIAWHLSHMSLNLRTSLYQTRAAVHTLKKDKPELIKINLERSALPITAIYTQENVKRTSAAEEDYFITPTIQKIYDHALKVAQTDQVTVMILGASGTGKENLAKYIHSNSVRSEKPYVPINCSAFSDSLLESRLFGYKKGAFTGADKDTAGLFELANEGTIFLDEIGDISPYMQQALLRVLQEKEIMPLGGKAKKVNVRVIAATNQQLVKLCEEGRFRWDLYYRLSVVELDIPTLIQRGKSDIKQMIEHFITQKKKELRRSKKLVIEREALDVLMNYSYPGNIRELENIIARLYVFNEERVAVDVLPKRLFQEAMNKPMNWEYVEREHILRVLKHYDGNKRQASMALGWAINTLVAKMEKYGVNDKGQ